MTTRTSQKFAFKNSRGIDMAGTLDLPGTNPLFYGVFAPCFTCLKESHGAVKICRAIAEAGGAMLRFDVTGLGGSKGDFADTNFTTRVDDIVSAVRAMEAADMPPTLLVGHSISGTAALSAMKYLPNIKLVATVGSPADPKAVIEKFERNKLIEYFDDRIEIMVVGTKVTFNKNFAADLLSQRVEEDTRSLDRELAVFHAPQDDIVAFENAKTIYNRAQASHDREMIALDNAATHLFEKRNDDANFVAKALMSRMARFKKQN